MGIYSTPYPPKIGICESRLCYFSFQVKGVNHMAKQEKQSTSPSTELTVGEVVFIAFEGRGETLHYADGSTVQIKGETAQYEVLITEITDKSVSFESIKNGRHGRRLLDSFKIMVDVANSYSTS